MKGESEEDCNRVLNGTKRGEGREEKEKEGKGKEKEEEEQEATEQRKTERRRGGQFGLMVVARNTGQGGERETRV